MWYCEILESQTPQQIMGWSKHMKDELLFLHYPRYYWFFNKLITLKVVYSFGHYFMIKLNVFNRSLQCIIQPETNKHWMSVHYDDVIKWKHFPPHWPFVQEIHRPQVNSPHKGQWRRALMFSLICIWINGWINNCEAGDLKCYRAHYDVIVMIVVRTL